jgi:UDP-2,3-diacylglucosamine pyrophosphatase LpxH
MAKRHVELLVISDVHLGAYGCHAAELNRYLKSVKVDTLILNGDILDGWQFKKSYFPESHTKVLRRILKMIESGTEVYYLTGNHDEVLRPFTDLHVGQFHLVNKLVMTLDGKRAWFFHGDVFDVTMRYSKWIAKLGAVGYALLIQLNTLVNNISRFFGKGKISLSKRIKDSVKKAVAFVSDFELTATDLAIDSGYDYVVVGHIHKPNLQRFSNERGSVLYLNSGDWVENLSSLEYHDGEWSIFRYNESEFTDVDERIIEPPDTIEMDVREKIIGSILTNGIHADPIRRTGNG